MEEKELVQLSKDGDQEAFGLLVKKHKRKVFNLAFSLTQDREMADDLAQEAFIRAYFGLAHFRFKSGFGTWLYRITINLIKDYLRKKQRMNKKWIQEMRENPFIQDDEMKRRKDEKMKEEQRNFVHRFIRALPKKYQIILSLRDIHGFSYDEISKILKISPGTVDSRLHRARKMLRKNIEPFLRVKGGDDEMQKI